MGKRSAAGVFALAVLAGACMEPWDTPYAEGAQWLSGDDARPIYNWTILNEGPGGRPRCDVTIRYASGRRYHHFIWWRQEHLITGVGGGPAPLPRVLGPDVSVLAQTTLPPGHVISSSGSVVCW